MGIPVMCMGPSGAGKSASLRNFKKDEIGIFNVASKPLPFKTDLPKRDGATYEAITKCLEDPKINAYVIDDSQYLLCFELFDRIEERGYEKFSSMAKSFYSLIQHVIRKTPPDVIVYFLHHIETVAETGQVKAKTIGKMLDEKLTLEGLFSVVLLAKTDGERYWFETQNNGQNSVKTPMGMFTEKEIENDLKLVDTTIRNYWELSPIGKINKTEKKESK